MEGQHVKWYFKRREVVNRRIWWIMRNTYWTSPFASLNLLYPVFFFFFFFSSQLFFFKSSSLLLLDLGIAYLRIDFFSIYCYRKMHILLKSWHKSVCLTWLMGYWSFGFKLYPFIIHALSSCMVNLWQWQGTPCLVTLDLLY